MRMGVVMRGGFRRGGIGRLRQFQSRLLSSICRRNVWGSSRMQRASPGPVLGMGQSARQGDSRRPARRSEDAGLRRFPSHPTRTPSLPPPVGKAGGVFLEEAITDRPYWQGLIFGRICLSRRVEWRGAPWCRRDCLSELLIAAREGETEPGKALAKRRQWAGERKVRAGQTWGVHTAWAPVGLTPA